MEGVINHAEPPLSLWLPKYKFPTAPPRHKTYPPPKGYSPPIDIHGAPAKTRVSPPKYSPEPIHRKTPNHRYPYRDSKIKHRHPVSTKGYKTPPYSRRNYSNQPRPNYNTVSVRQQKPYDRVYPYAPVGHAYSRINPLTYPSRLTPVPHHHRSSTFAREPTFYTRRQPITTTPAYVENTNRRYVNSVDDSNLNLYQYYQQQQQQRSTFNHRDKTSITHNNYEKYNFDDYISPYQGLTEKDSSIQISTTDVPDYFTFYDPNAYFQKISESKTKNYEITMNDSSSNQYSKELTTGSPDHIRPTSRYADYIRNGAQDIQN